MSRDNVYSYKIVLGSGAKALATANLPVRRKGKKELWLTRLLRLGALSYG